jgi:uncharacterized repeat protein (TIGR01451 family)
MRRFALLIVTTTLLASSLATIAAQPLGPQLHLHRATFDARMAGRVASNEALGAVAAGPYAIVQFRGPIAPADRAALEQTGVTLLEYIPDFAYLVRGSSVQLAAAASLPQVYARAPLTVADKLSPALLSALARGDPQVGPLRVLGWPGDESQLESELRAAAMNVADVARTDILLRLAALPSVRWIEPVGRPRLQNDVARTIMHVGSAWQGRGIYGAGQIIAVADSGLDTGVPATLSPDFAGRLVATHVLSAGGDLGDDFGHGTHVAGSAAGAGVQSGASPAQHTYSGSFAGVAPEAGLVIQAFEADQNGEVIGLDPDYYKLFAQAYADGARLHTDSWGDPTGPASQPQAQYGGYPYGSQRADKFVWDHKDMAIFFAAGNDGRDGVPGNIGFCEGGDGVIDPDSLLAPGTAKNVITVGAAESQRASGGLSQLPWLYFDLTSYCFGTEPIATDLTSSNANGMAAFSSRGPADDGRTKPDLVAPGTNIVSNRSHYPNAGTLWGEYEGNSNYAYSGGTSMATPLAAGSGVLVRQWLTTRGIPNPSAAAIKATLLNTTFDMAPGQYGGAATPEIPTTRPNNVEGWGRVDLGFMSAPLPYGLWIDDQSNGITTGQSVTYVHTSAHPLEVLSSAQPLRIMLAWTDPPASLAAARQLVNDLDLKVVGPGGVIYRGNNAASGDRLNNVEGIVIQNPPVGRYTVEVRGYNVPVATQPYALAVAGPLSGAGQLALIKSATPALQVAAGGLITYTLALNANHAVAQPVTLTDRLPVHTSFVSASHGGTRNGSLITWSVPSLAAGATVIRTLVVRVDPAAVGTTLIVNADYRATDGVDLPAAGPAVGVRVKGEAAAGEQKLYLPQVMR